MKTGNRLCLLLLVMPLIVDSAKKGKKDRKSRLEWKTSSMPALNKRFESVYEGKDLTFDCRTQGQPKPNVKWLKDGIEVKNNNNVEVKKFNLNLKALTTDMSGNYTCVVSNKHGQIEWTFQLDVQVKIWPLLIEGPHNITHMVGSNVAFRCRVLNDPQATVRWQKTHSNKNMDENTLQADFLPGGEDPHVLTLNNIQRADEGEYRCMVGNVWGLKYSSAWLTVIEPVLVPDLPRLPEMDKKKNRNNNINSNNVVQPELGGTDSFDSNKLNTGDLDNSLYDEAYNNEDLIDTSDYGLDPYMITTKRPKNRTNNRRKDGRKKDKKGKDKNNVEEMIISTTSASVKLQPATSMEDSFKTTYPEIWDFNTDKDIDDDDDEEYDNMSDTRSVKTSNDDKDETQQNNPVKDETMEGSSIGNNEHLEGSISSWTIYTIVGAIGGVILLIGLVGITLTLCCKKEENNVYKSTPV